jgi:WD40 repeat protein
MVYLLFYIYRSNEYLVVFRCPLTGLIATASGDNGVRIFREEESKQTDAPPSFSLIASNTQAHFQDVNCVSFNPKEAGLLASCSDDGTIKLWRIKEQSF